MPYPRSRLKSVLQTGLFLLASVHVAHTADSLPTATALLEPVQVLLLGDSTVACRVPRVVAPKDDQYETVIQKLIAA